MKAALLALVGLAMLSPPSGRPPIGPLERSEPRLYDLRYEVTLNSAIPYLQNDPRNPIDTRHPRALQFGGVFDLGDTPIVMPVVFRGTYHTIDHDSLSAQMWLANRPDPGLRERFRIDDGLPHHTALAVLPIVRFRGQTIRWNIAYRLRTYSSRIDDAAAARIPWPREWPEEVADGLAPQMYIESGEPLFAETVARVSEGQLRMVPPYLAAKDLVRYCLNELLIAGNGLRRGRMGILQGLDIQGAAATARTGRGGPHDLVCVCVAMLRAAGIPARPVIGVTENEKGRNVFVSWAEFYLPDAGWIPFDPDAMKGKGLRYRDVHEPWPEFGTMKDLNRRLPIAYHFMPPRAVEAPQYPALWGWDPRPGGAPSAEQRIVIDIVSRGPAAPEAR